MNVNKIVDGIDIDLWRITPYELMRFRDDHAQNLWIAERSLAFSEFLYGTISGYGEQK